MILKINNRTFYHVQRIITGLDKKNYYIHITFGPGPQEWKEHIFKQIEYNPKKDLLTIHNDNLELYIPL